MSPAARSMLVWTIYVLVLGVALLLIPNVILSIFSIAETSETWIRVVGMLLIVLGILYPNMIRHEDRPMFEATVYARWFAVVALTVLAFTAGPWQLVLFAVVDFAGATWTFLALRSEGAPKTVSTA